MTSTNPSILPSIPWQNYISGIAFSIICVLGIMAGISPSRCSRPCHSTKKPQSKSTNSSYTTPPKIPTGKQGHHPTCNHYTGHIIKVKGRVYCAGCSGLVTGAFLSLVGTVLYFFLAIPLYYPHFFFWLGFVMVVLGLLQHPFYLLLKIQHGLIRVIMNIFFVVGSFLLLAGIAELTNNLVIEIYLLLLILYWIFTRIIMSKWTHRRICNQCDLTGCPFSEI